MGEPWLDLRVSSCSGPFLRERIANLAGDKNQIEEEDWEVVSRSFNLSFFEQNSLDAFREKLKKIPFMTALGIRDDFIRLLEQASKREHRESAFGRFVLLFGEGHWEECFPELAKKRREVDKAVLKMMSDTSKRLSFSWQDVNFHINIPLFDVGSTLRCFVWAEGHQSYICGEAKQETEGEYILFHFGVSKRGVYPKDVRGHSQFGLWDGRTTIAIFDPPMEKALNRKGKKSLLQDAAKFVGLHEKAHTKESYLLKRFMKVASTERGFEKEAAFDCFARETLADIEALKNFQGPPAQAALVYEALHTKLRGEAKTCAEHTDQLATRFLQGAGHIDTSVVDQIQRALKTYLTELTQSVEGELKPFEAQARRNLKQDSNWEKLEPIIQREKLANEQVRLFLERDPQKVEEIRFFINRHRLAVEALVQKLDRP